MNAAEGGWPMIFSPQKVLTHELRKMLIYVCRNMVLFETDILPEANNVKRNVFLARGALTTDVPQRSSTLGTQFVCLVRPLSTRPFKQDVKIATTTLITSGVYTMAPYGGNTSRVV